jgi:hypothetical protein
MSVFVVINFVFVWLSVCLFVMPLCLLVGWCESESHSVCLSVWLSVCICHWIKRSIVSMRRVLPWYTFRALWLVEMLKLEQRIDVCDRSLDEINYSIIMMHN